ncbi:MAG: arylsulfatase [Bacteroides sp.]|nr:arylsulfatase [Bacteroides sp.]MCM1379934.1 arylsulfatase [Bacteroides sp.]MCM1446211.1 arylsulfatase [Prevotella sp.]
MNSKIFFSTLGAIAAAAAPAAAQQNNQPNIIYIMCDDMGYGDLGCYGQQLISTPNIDSLATQGIRFTQAYAGSPVSAPSRATFMTGQHSGHTHVRGNKEYWRGTDRVFPEYNGLTDHGTVGQEPYKTDHVIIPEIFKDNGYNTGMFGKWAGGYEGSVSTPEKRGIDEFYGYICQFQAHLYYPNFLNEYSKSAGDTETHRVTLEQNVQHAMFGSDYYNRAQYSADLIHDKAMAWLDKQDKDTPFLGIFTYTLPHAELLQPNDSILQAYQDKFCECEEKSFAGQSGNRYNATPIAHAQFAGMITRLDEMVGQIMAKLEAKGLSENTVLIFTSDNGPHEEGGADPDYFNRDGLLRGTKRSTTEGGIRIPFIVRWPAKIAAGQTSDHQFAFYDLMATFCDIAGIENYEERYRNKDLENDWFDGISIYPTLTGEGEQIAHDHLYWEFHESNMLGVRKGNWKLVVKAGVCQLYDLATDLHEDNNLAETYPDIVRELVDIIHQEHTQPISDFNLTIPE